MMSRSNDTAVISILMTTIILSGCNAFTRNYEGARFETVSNAILVETAPEDARKIGHARFLSYEVLSSEDSLSTARDVGAEFVVFTSEDLGERDGHERTTMMAPGGPGGSPVALNVPVPVTRRWYEYVAEFYRMDDENSER